MNEFIEKLIGRLEEKENEAVLKAPNTSDISNIEYQKWMMKSYGFKESIEIVNQLAEEYRQDLDKNSQGWIPCSERLPEKNGMYLVTQKRYSLDTRRMIGIETDYVQFSCGEWCRARFLEVIAWQPLPSPYQPK